MGCHPERGVGTGCGTAIAPLVGTLEEPGKDANDETDGER